MSIAVTWYAVNKGTSAGNGLREARGTYIARSTLLVGQRFRNKSDYLSVYPGNSCDLGVNSNDDISKWDVSWEEIGRVKEDRREH